MARCISYPRSPCTRSPRAQTCATTADASSATRRVRLRTRRRSVRTPSRTRTRSSRRARPVAADAARSCSLRSASSRAGNATDSNAAAYVPRCRSSASRLNESTTFPADGKSPSFSAFTLRSMSAARVGPVMYFPPPAPTPPFPPRSRRSPSPSFAFACSNTNFDSFVRCFTYVASSSVSFKSHSFVRCKCGCFNPNAVEFFASAVSDVRMRFNSSTCLSPDGLLTGFSASATISRTPPSRKSLWINHMSECGRNVRSCECVVSSSSSPSPSPPTPPPPPPPPPARAKNSSASSTANDSFAMSLSLTVSGRLYTSTDAMMLLSANIRSSYASLIPVASKPSVSTYTTAASGSPGVEDFIVLGSPHTHTPFVSVCRVCPTPKPSPHGTPRSWFSRNDFPLRYGPMTTTGATGPSSERSMSSPSR
eukprot:31017-Pelagococcus_subviridis.AAC.14